MGHDGQSIDIHRTRGFVSLHSSDTLVCISIVLGHQGFKENEGRITPVYQCILCMIIIARISGPLSPQGSQHHFRIRQEVR